jgi:hypothetical protein
MQLFLSSLSGFSTNHLDGGPQLASGSAAISSYQPTAFLTGSETQRQLSVGTDESFRILGQRAQPDFEDLHRLMNQTNTPYTASHAAAALGHVGKSAFPPLLAVLTNAQHPARTGALNAINEISDLGDAAQLAVPAITNCLNPTNDPVLQMTR